MSEPVPVRILVTTVGRAKGADAVAAIAAGRATGGGDGPAVLIDITPAKPRPATLVAPRETKAIEAELDAIDRDVRVRARGRICVATIEDDDRTPEKVSALIEAVPATVPCVIVAPPARYRELLEDERLAVSEVIFRADESEDEGELALLELAREEAEVLVDSVRVVDQRPGWRTSRRALAGSSFADESGQATPLVLGAVFVLVVGTIALVAIAGAITGKARAQTTADLSALSAARSMKDDLPRLLAPPTLPNGLPNPAHMSKFQYLARARLAAVTVAVKNGASPLRVSVRFPDAVSFAPVRVRVSVRSRVGGAGAGKTTSDWGEARVGVPVSMGSVPSIATGGGYSGPLAERQGHGMRPDVAEAFDQMAAAAGGAGVSLTINSAFRSDAEQAALFAANPNPTMVAPPGQSLHRCGTELDLGASDGYAWLVANGGRFGFVQRYSWEAWHWGFTRGPEPCSAEGNHVTPGGGDPESGLGGALPSFVPAKYKPAILRSAMKWGVSAALLAAQLYAESGFDPNAGSPAGAQGIAQFMPSTAAAYGLSDPYDPDEAIDAQGHLMSDLLKQFGSPALALAAYNAGPGAVSPCNCVPDYPETQAYVAKILAMLSGVGAIAPMPMEIELVK